MILLDFLFFRKVVLNMCSIYYFWYLYSFKKNYLSMCTYVSGDVSIPNICIPKIKDLIFLLDLGLETFLPKKRLLLNLFSTYLLKSPPQGSMFGDYFNLTSNIHTHNDNVFAFLRNNSTIAFFLKNSFIFLFSAIQDNAM